MVSAVPEGRPLSSPLQVAGRWLARASGTGEAFICGVRVEDGSVDGEGRFWRFRRSVVEPPRPDGVVALRHGGTVLLLKVDPPIERDRWRPGNVIVAALEVDNGAHLRISCRRNAAQRLLNR